MVEDIELSMGAIFTDKDVFDGLIDNNSTSGVPSTDPAPPTEDYINIGN